VQHIENAVFLLVFVCDKDHSLCDMQVTFVLAYLRDRPLTSVWRLRVSPWMRDWTLQIYLLRPMMDKH